MYLEDYFCGTFNQLLSVFGLAIGRADLLHYVLLLEAERLFFADDLEVEALLAEIDRV